MSRTNNKVIDLAGRRFRINKFDAQTGSYIVYQLFSAFLPMVTKGGLPEISDETKLDSFVSTLSVNLPTLPKDQFFALQKDCLSVCQELVNETGVEMPIQVMLANGDYGVSDIENNAMLAMMLTIHTIIFNITGFFSESGLNLKDLGMFGLNR